MHLCAGLRPLPVAIRMLAEPNGHWKKACWALPNPACLRELHTTVVSACCHLPSLGWGGDAVVHEVGVGQEAQLDVACNQTEA